MNSTINANGKPAQGVEAADVEDSELNHAKVKKWLFDDIARCMTLLDGIRKDENLQDLMVTYILGRIRNEMNKVDPKQGNLFGK